MKKPSGVGGVVLVVIGIVFLYQVIIQFADVKPASESPSPVTLASVAAPKNDKQHWVYSTDVDDVSKKDERSARVESKNSHELKFPYQGGTVGSLTIRKHPRYGKDVVFQINKGQLLCSGVYDCEVIIQFDDKKPATVLAKKSADGSIDTMFLGSYEKMTREIRAAKKVIIEVVFYQNGSRHFEFDVSNLKFD